MVELLLQTRRLAIQLRVLADNKPEMFLVVPPMWCCPNTNGSKGIKVV